MKLLRPDPARHREEAARRDRRRLQGAWSFLSGGRRADLFVAGDHFTVHFRSGDIYVGTFRLDPTARPRAMDLLIREGPARHRGKLARAIYEFDGDHLLWCPGEPGSPARPRAFPPGNDPTHLCIVFRRSGRPR